MTQSILQMTGMLEDQGQRWHAPFKNFLGLPIFAQ